MKKVLSKLNRIFFTKSLAGFSFFDQLVLLSTLLFVTGGVFGLELYKVYGYWMVWVLMLFTIIPVYHMYVQRQTGLLRALVGLLGVRMVLYAVLAIASMSGVTHYRPLLPPYDALVIVTIYLSAHCL